VINYHSHAVTWSQHHTQHSKMKTVVSQVTADCTRRCFTQ